MTHLLQTTSPKVVQTKLLQRLETVAEDYENVINRLEADRICCTGDLPTWRLLNAFIAADQFQQDQFHKYDQEQQVQRGIQHWIYFSVTASVVGIAQTTSTQSEIIKQWLSAEICVKHKATPKVKASGLTLLVMISSWLERVQHQMDLQEKVINILESQNL